MWNGNITDPAIAGYIADTWRPQTEFLGKLRESAEKDNVPVIRRDSEALLGSVIDIMRPRSILEIGAAVGYSAIFFAERAGADCRITTIEKDTAAADTARSNVETCGLKDRVTVITGDAAELIAGLDDTFDLVFIDAAKSHYREYWDVSIGKCRLGSVIICDNTLMSGAVCSEKFDEGGRFRTSARRMREFTEYITNTDNARTSVIPVGDGMSVSVITQVPRG